MSEQEPCPLIALTPERDEPEDQPSVQARRSRRSYLADESSRAFPEIHRDAVLMQAFKITADLSGAEDVLQSLLVNLLRLSAAQRKSIRSFDRYIAASVRHLALRWRKKHQAPEHESLSVDFDERTTEDFTRLVADENEINYLLNQIPEGYREALVYFFAEDCTAEEVAARLGISTDAVKKRLQRALVKLAAARAAYTGRGE
jgi:RNA polymerase sigma factor (sigma-70 family)